MYEMIQEGVSQRPSTSLSLFLMIGEIVLFIAENLYYANIGRSAKMHWKEEFCVNLAIVIIFIGQMSSVERKKREKSFFHNKKLTASPCGPLCSTEGNEITWYPFHQQRFVYSLHFYFKHLCIYPVNYTCQYVSCLKIILLSFKWSTCLEFLDQTNYPVKKEIQNSRKTIRCNSYSLGLLGKNGNV